MADLPGSAIVECNVLYKSPRQNIQGHGETLAINGWRAQVDILDEAGDVSLPVRNGFHLKEVADEADTPLSAQEMDTYDEVLRLLRGKQEIACTG